MAPGETVSVTQPLPAAGHAGAHRGPGGRGRRPFARSRRSSTLLVQAPPSPPRRPGGAAHARRGDPDLDGRRPQPAARAVAVPVALLRTPAPAAATASTRGHAVPVTVARRGSIAGDSSHPRPRPSPKPPTPRLPHLPPRPRRVLRSAPERGARHDQRVCGPHRRAPVRRWCYVVRTAASVEPVVESAPSNEVCVDIRDVAPPAAPVGVADPRRRGRGGGVVEPVRGARPRRVPRLPRAGRRRAGAGRRGAGRPRPPGGMRPRHAAGFTCTPSPRRPGGQRERAVQARGGASPVKLYRFEHEGRPPGRARTARAACASWRAIRSGRVRDAKGTVQLCDVRLLAPVTPSKIVAIGLNYRDHAAEQGKPRARRAPPLPEAALVGDRAGRDHPRSRPGRAASTTRRRWASSSAPPPATSRTPRPARAHILGAVCVNDVTARELQDKDVQFTRAKGFDTFCPVGPCLATGLDYGNLRGHRPRERRGAPGELHRPAHLRRPATSSGSCPA